MNQELACAILAKAGHEVDVAADGEEAVQAVQKVQYDLVLMDIQMPRLDGIAATRAIRALPGPERNVPILAVTANVLPEQVREFLSAGMNGHVAKPIQQKELHGTIATVLAGAQPAHGSVSNPETEDFDGGAFESVAETLPPASLAKHACALREQLHVLASMDSSDAEAAEQLAHKIVSQAGMLGLSRLSRRARDVEEAARARADIHPSLDGFRAALPDFELYISPRLDAQ